MVTKIREIVNEGVGKAEDAVHSILSIINNGKDKVYHSFEDVTRRAEESGETAKTRMEESGEKAEGKAEAGKEKLKGEL